MIKSITLMTRNDMEMGVEDHLARVGTNVTDEVVGSGTSRLENLGGNQLHSLKNSCSISSRCLTEIARVVLRDDEGVTLVNGIQVQEGINKVVLVHLGRGNSACNDLAEEAVRVCYGGHS